MNAAPVSLDIRDEAAERFRSLGWPTPRLEAWKYTNLAPLQKIDWRTADAAPASFDNAGMSYSGIAIAELTFVNGRLAGGIPDELPDGIRIRRFDGDFGPAAAEENNALVALNTWLAQDGAVIDVDKPFDGFVHLLFVGSGDGVWSHPRNVIRVARGAQIAIVESYVGSGAYFTNSVTQIEAGEGAVVDHTRLECESSDAFHVGNLRVRQARASNVTSRAVLIGGKLVRNEIGVALEGEGATIALDGLFIGSGTQHLDNHTVVDHLKPHCESLELYKGVLDQNARGVFDGTIIVRPGASKTVSRQTNKNLLLSETAIADSKPNLEIYNDDVKCNHGSTIGQLDEQALFYLRSRGLGEQEARGLLTYAFASEIVDRMKIEPVREQIRRAMFRQMPERLPERRGASR